MAREHCDDCKHLNPKEIAQTEDADPHKCVLYGYVLGHKGQHPHVPKPKQCLGPYSEKPSRSY